MTDDPARAAHVALSSLPKVGPVRLRALLDHAGGPEAAWALVREGRLDAVDLRAGGGHGPLVAELRHAALAVDPAELLRRHRAAGVAVLVPGDDAWPATFTEDPEPPELLFALGDAALLGDAAVAVVGTRRCTAAGAAVAGGLGADLAAAGVHVVSGLALGIDGAAHRGALAGGGRPIGVVGSGLDHVYPQAHRRLWADVAAAGVLISEAALGCPPERWRFPARNRLIAALSLAVVVVESRARGGSMSTVAAALERDRAVLAVPGPVAAEQSAGTNQLLSEGAAVARDAVDVLVAIGSAATPGRRTPAGPSGAADPGPDPVVRAVAGVLSTVPVGVDRIAATTGVGVAAALTALARLEAAGVARRVAGGYEQVVR